MKRLIAILMVSLLFLISLCGCNTANVDSEVSVEDDVVTSTDVSVSYGTYPEETYEDIVTSQDDVGNLDFETIKKIKKDYVKTLNKNISLKLISLKYYDTLSDGSMVVSFRRLDVTYLQTYTSNDPTITIADEYTFDKRNKKIIYKNGEFHTIKNAYDKGIISKDILDEFAKKFPDDIKKINK